MYSKVAIAFVLLFKVCLAREPMDDKTDQDFQDDCLKTSNEYRAKHGALPLTTDPDIVQFAKSRCAFNFKNGAMTHEGAGNYGENLYHMAFYQDFPLSTCKEAVKLWYDESVLYDYNSHGFNAATGHFTQLIWKNTSSVGCARCYGHDQGNRKYEIYVVCNYMAPGNVMSDKQFKENVLPPQQNVPVQQQNLPDYQQNVPDYQQNVPEQQGNWF